MEKTVSIKHAFLSFAFITSWQCLHIRITLKMSALVSNDATIKHHTFSGLEQHTFIIPYFCGLKIWHGTHWAKTTVLAHYVLSKGSAMFAQTSTFQIVEATFLGPWSISFICKANAFALVPSFFHNCISLITGGNISPLLRIRVII